MSTERHTDVCPNSILASSTPNSTATLHSLTEDGINSNARLNTAFFLLLSGSSSAARSHSFVDVGKRVTARCKTERPFASELCNLAASNHTSSASGHASHPNWINFRAAIAFPAISSTRAAAIQPGACFGLVVVTDFNSNRAFLISPTSEAVLTLIEFRSVR